MLLQPRQLDSLKEMVNIGVGHAAGVLNAMLHSHVNLHVPEVYVLNGLELNDKVRSIGKETLSAVRLGFKGPFAGNASLVFPADSAIKLVSILTGEETSNADLDAIRVGTLTEVGNIVLNGVMGAIGNELKLQIFYSVPIYMENSLETLLSARDLRIDSTVVWVQTRFSVETQYIAGDIILVFEVGSLDLLLAAVDRAMGFERV